MATGMTKAYPLNKKIMPINIAGSSKFGRHSKISAEKTYNMFISDEWLVPTPGYIKIANIDPLAEGRGIFTSVRENIMVAVIGNGVWVITSEIKKFGREIPIGSIGERLAIKVGEIETFTGDVFIDENENQEIGICDKKNIYMYNYGSATFQKATINFTPGYLTYQDTYFIAPDIDNPRWFLSGANDGLTWQILASTTGGFQTKPDNPKAVVRVPGKSNQVFVMGSTVTESWNDIGYKLFPYFRTNSFNIDYGCVNQATIAMSDKFVVWLGSNEHSSPTIMVSDGGPAQQISTDGINFALSQLTEPSDSYGFLFKSDGHLFYVLTFDTDNVSYLYDFNTDKFYFLTDEKMGNYIAKKVTFFNDDYYFISLIDGNIYRMSADITTYDDNIIPRIRVANTIRLPNGLPFIGQQLGFTLEQGENSSISRIDTSVSYDGGVTFGNSIAKELNSLGIRQNKFSEYDFGYMNEFTPQFRFWGEGRFVCTDGFMEIYV